MHIARWSMITLLALTACATSRTDGPNTAAAATTPAMVGNSALLTVSRPLIRDIPTPMGFKLVEAVSRYYDLGHGQRVVDQVYLGKAEPQQLLDYFKRVLPAEQWQLRQLQQVGKTWTLVLIKAGQRLTITFERDRDDASLIRCRLLCLPADGAVCKPQGNR